MIQIYLQNMTQTKYLAMYFIKCFAILLKAFENIKCKFMSNQTTILAMTFIKALIPKKYFAMSLKSFENITAKLFI